MNTKLLIASLGITLWKASFSQDVVQQYIKEGFEKNNSIQQQQFAFEKSVYALKEAKSLFLPNVTLMTDYFLSDGGRAIDLPLGDLLNSTYSTLNQLTNTNSFPQLENQSILLNPDNYYDAKIRTTMPLLNLEIEYNKRIKQDMVSMQKVEIDLYKRELAKEIKTAYFKYLQSMNAVEIYVKALDLVKESKRINESLFRNDKVNRTVLIRAENEITKYEAILETAQQNSNSAKAYFNFLLNRNLSENIIVDSSYQKAASFLGDSSTISRREELLKLNIGSTINQHLVGLSKSYIVPKLSTFIDLGSQGFDWEFDNQTKYYFFGLSLQWDLFSAGNNNYKIKQAQIEHEIIQSHHDYALTQIQLQFTTSINNFNASLVRYQAAVSAYDASQRYYADILQLYQEGQSLYIELLDAQNQLVQSELQVNISRYDTYIEAAEVERANASFNLNN
jgi:outer membrane protein TolC